MTESISLEYQIDHMDAETLVDKVVEMQGIEPLDTTGYFNTLIERCKTRHKELTGKEMNIIMMHANG